MHKAGDMEKQKKAAAYTLDVAVLAKATKMREVLRHLRGAGVPQNLVRTVVGRLAHNPTFTLLRNLLEKHGEPQFLTRLDRMATKVYDEDPPVPFGAEQALEPKEAIARALAVHFHDVHSMVADLRSRVDTIEEVLATAKKAGIGLDPVVERDVRHLQLTFANTARALHCTVCDDCLAELVREHDEQHHAPTPVVNAPSSKVLN